MNFRNLAPSVLMSAALLTGCSHFRGDKIEEPQVAEAQPEASAMEITHESVSKLVENWPDSSRSAVNNMISRYGLPAEATKSQLIWFNTAPFKRTTVYRDEITHNFPMPHSDVLEQVIDYKVPLDKVDELIKFDGSLTVDRTRGELSSRNDREEMNFISLNLADEIIRNRKTVDQARTEYAQATRDFAFGNTAQFMTSLNFIPASETADADMAHEGTLKVRQGMEAQEEVRRAQEKLEEGQEEP